MFDVVCICLAQGVAPFGGVALLEWVCHCVDFKALVLSAWETVFS